MQQVKTFTEKNAHLLQEAINEWIVEQNAAIEVTTIQYAATALPFDSNFVSMEYSALILYQPANRYKPAQFIPA